MLSEDERAEDALLALETERCGCDGSRLCRPCQRSIITMRERGAITEATREQAALLRECRDRLREMVEAWDAPLDDERARVARARALLLRLPASESVMGKQGDSGSVDIPASDSEREEKREEPCPFCTYGVMGAPCICPKGQALPLGEK